MPLKLINIWYKVCWGFNAVFLASVWQIGEVGDGCNSFIFEKLELLSLQMMYED
jgi:hypothetical protein